MRQSTLAEEGFEKYRKPTRREKFLNEMDQVIPWKDLCKAIEPFYPKPLIPSPLSQAPYPKLWGAGRCPVGFKRMLRIHFLQHWFQPVRPGGGGSVVRFARPAAVCED